ncbi:hypothetical protein [Priestia flexa]|uniref:hypothetical protein n=1 Tax=Priestia flexa TaxID=86664 RepID=UPI0024921D6B|nr:hypothetical protein [Priestia flexa]
MDLLSSKVIKTARGLELYIDSVENITIKGIHIPTTSKPYYGVKFEIDYFLLEEHKYYDLQQNYFCLVMSENFQSIKLEEPEMQSLFGVKNEEEFKATKHLLSDWLIKTNAYREAILQSLNEHKEHGTKEGNEDIKKTITFLKELLELKTIDIEQAPI